MDLTHDAFSLKLHYYHMCRGSTSSCKKHMLFLKDGSTWMAESLMFPLHGLRAIIEPFVVRSADFSKSFFFWTLICQSLKPHKKPFERKRGFSQVQI